MVLAEFPWQVFLTPFGIPIIAIVAVFTWLSIASVSEAVAKVMCNRDDADLKLELLARGFSSQEIISVVESGRELTPAAHRNPHHAHSAARHATVL